MTKATFFNKLFFTVKFFQNARIHCLFEEYTGSAQTKRNQREKLSLFFWGGGGGCTQVTCF